MSRESSIVSLAVGILAVILERDLCMIHSTCFTLVTLESRQLVELLVVDASS